jgi:NAD(P)H-nitrite reductase large subunit
MIGSGPASISAAQAIRSVDASAQIMLLSAEPHGYYSRPGLAYYLAKEIPEDRLHPFSAEDFARLGIGMVAERAVAIDAAAHTVTLASGQAMGYDRLLIATGSQAIPVGVPGAALDGVVKLDDMNDARDVIRRCSRAKAAVVVGGGITALEIVEGLRAHRVHVHYFMRKDRYWGNVLSETESRIVEQGLADQGVEIHHFAELAEVLGDARGHVVGVRTVAGQQIGCEMVAVAIGVLPLTQLARSAGILCGRGILVDEYLRSNVADIFAAGDVAEVCDPLTDRRTMEVLWNSAKEKGRVAGLNMASEQLTAYNEGAPLNVTRLAGFKITIMGTVGGGGEDSDLKGISRGDSETWRQAGNSAVVECRAGDANVRLILGEHTIDGAVVMGDQALSFPLQELIGARADVSAVLPALRAPAAPVAPLLGEFYRTWKAPGV